MGVEGDGVVGPGGSKCVGAFLGELGRRTWHFGKEDRCFFGGPSSHSSEAGLFMFFCLLVCLLVSFFGCGRELYTIEFFPSHRYIM